MAEADRVLATRLSYAQCWEDARILREGLRLRPTDDVLSIASAGDNVIALALAGVTSVTAVDLSVPQLSLCELKLAAGALPYAQFRQLFGLAPCRDRVALYREVRERLTEPARRFWDDHPSVLRAGVLDSGRFEKYLALFRERVLPLVHRRRKVERWFELRDAEDRRRYYDDAWNNLRWRLLFRVFFSRRVMAARGRSPEQFAHVEGPIGGVLLERARKMLVDLPLDDNGYAQWILLGRYLHDEALPDWLTPQGHRRLLEVAPRIRLVHGTVQQVMAEAGRGAFSAFNLSDVPEYLSTAQTEDLYDALLLSARSGARIAYWNLFVPRRRPDVHARRILERTADAIALHARDRAPLYGAFRVEEVR